MSTRALYTFIGKHEFETEERLNHVYKHHDGYPLGAARFIEKSLKFAWKLPRFEIDDFAAAFIAANKDGAGGVYISNGQHGDISYRYEIRRSSDEDFLNIKAFECAFNNRANDQLIFEGTLQEFKIFADKED